MCPYVLLFKVTRLILHVKRLHAEHPKPTTKHMIIKIREMQHKLQLQEKEIGNLIGTIRSIHDMLHYIPGATVCVNHIRRQTNPADGLTKILL